MSLQQWHENAWLNKVQPSRHTVASLLEKAERDIADASVEALSVDGRFGHAYDAVRSLCETALHAAGYEVPRGQRAHERVLESLKFTLGGPWVATADFFSQCRRQRHDLMYKRAGVSQQKDADDLLQSARSLYEAVRDWLRRKHPDLL